MKKLNYSLFHAVVVVVVAEAVLVSSRAFSAHVVESHSL